VASAKIEGFEGGAASAAGGWRAVSRVRGVVGVGEGGGGGAAEGDGQIAAATVRHVAVPHEGHALEVVHNP
jgi:hypothetical protein